MEQSFFFLLLILFFLGPLVGFVSTFFGLGGGVFIVPLLSMMFPLAPPAIFVACSRGVILLNSTVNSYRFWRMGKLPPWPMLLILGIPLTIGAMVGTELSIYLNPRAVRWAIGLALLGVVANIIFSPTPSHPMPRLSFVRGTILVFTVLVGGVVSGLSGVGGGVVLIPAMVVLAKVPLQSLPSYLNFSMMVANPFSVLLFALQSPEVNPFEGLTVANWQVGYLNLAISLIIFAGALLTSKFGATLADKIDPTVAKKCFAIVLLLLALKMFFI